MFLWFVFCIRVSCMSESFVDSFTSMYTCMCAKQKVGGETVKNIPHKSKKEREIETGRSPRMTYWHVEATVGNTDDEWPQHAFPHAAWHSDISHLTSLLQAQHSVLLQSSTLLLVFLIIKTNNTIPNGVSTYTNILSFSSVILDYLFILWMFWQIFFFYFCLGWLRTMCVCGLHTSRTCQLFLTSTALSI